ncbi:MAG: cation:proton antiporter subunit C [Myxococcota bacterium]|jgi:multicomponent Na+:H+ antiporter subunit C|nr:cation:proton antiporter subunit C [Myxococcota bacterium]
MTFLSNVAGLWNYWAVITLMMIGLYIMISRGNLVKKLMGMNIFQVSVIMLYVSMGKVAGGTPPILIEGAEDVAYSNPLPHVLMLTAIVVGVATTAVGLALVVRVKEAYGTVEEDEVVAIDQATDREEAAAARAAEAAHGEGA